MSKNVAHERFGGARSINAKKKSTGQNKVKHNLINDVELEEFETKCNVDLESDNDLHLCA